MKKILLIFLLFSNYCIGQVNLNQGLIAYYPFNGNANDATGNGFNGTPLNGVQLTTDRFGNPNSAYYFDGIDDRILVSDNGGLSPSKLTLACYFNADLVAQQMLIGKIDFANGNGATYNMGVYNNAGATASFSIYHQTSACNGQVPSTLQYSLSAPFSPGTNSWHCAVGTFENSVLKFYIDGILISTDSYPFNDAKNCTNTNLVIGSWWSGELIPFKGKIDDIRVYNRVLSQDEVNALCSQQTLSTGISGIINDYTPVIGFNPCGNKITVEDAAAFNIGDTVLMIQMKGAVIDSTNTAAFGTVTDYKNAGNYEFSYVKSKAGNIVELKNNLTRQYDIPNGKVQLIRVPFYQSATVAGTLTCLPWDGRKGGVLVLNAAGSIDLNADINVSGKGFRGGSSPNPFANVLNCSENNYSYPNTSIKAAAKGESIYNIGTQINYGKGKNAGGGGGGNGHNSGGGGGGNAGPGGFGGYQLEACGNSPFDNRGIGGQILNYNNVSNKIFLGSGGGSGHSDNINGIDMKGGAGGGIAIIITGSLANNGFKIISDGTDAENCNNNTNNCHDGSGGGGAAGTILIQSTTIASAIPVEAKGGNGGNLVLFNNPIGAGRIGPGGGGGGGSVWLSQNSLPGNINTNLAGGANGVIFQDNNNPWGATPGQAGNTFFSLRIPVDTVLFKSNIDSVAINASATICKTFDFSGFARTLTTGIQSWQWNFGDNSGANVQNTTHTYGADGAYTVRLIVTDLNGCKDSVSKQIAVSSCTASSPSIINNYAAVTAFDPCNNKITLDDAALFNIGDTVVMMQMKGADIDQTNSNNFGTITSLNNAGNYEFNYVKNKTGNEIELKNTLLKQYDIPLGKVQLIRVPYFQTVTISDTLTCLPWDGSKGGVLVLNSASDVILNAPVDVSRKGFRGGQVGSGYNCNNVNNWAVPTGIGGSKGEGIAEYIAGMEAGGARQANGGGGAYSANTGAGGGANGGAGGLGGQQFDRCSSTTQSIEGSPLTYFPGGKIYLGGGGGGCQQDNGQPVSMGGNGGGIVIIKGATLNSNNQQIISNGENITTLVRDEGGAGGGAGGTVLLFANSYTGNLSVEANGGDGSSNDNQIYPTGCHGPGGGGGGGFVGFSNAALPASVSIQLNGGKPGLILNPSSVCYNTTHGAAAGSVGASGFNFTIPEAILPFKKNIDSVKIKDSATNCKSFDFKSLAFVNGIPIRGWEWSFDDGTSSFLEDVSHTYDAAGAHDVKLVVTDDNGCKDSTAVTVHSSGINFDFTFEQDICNPRAVKFTAIGDTTAIIYWSLGDGTVINNIRNPVHVFADTGYYLVQYSTGNTCVDTVKKTILISYRNGNIVLTPDTSICFNTSKLLRSNIDSSLNFCWSPTNFLNNINFANPTTSTPSRITYHLLAATAENNLVINSDFSGGNTGFVSSFTFNNSSSLSDEEYTVTNSLLSAGLVTDCKDHTSSGGNMFIGKIGIISGTNVWQQTTNVQPNTNYIFSAWLLTIVPVALNSPELGLSINDNIALGNMTAASTGPTCQWKKYFVTWNSGNNTNAKLAIVNLGGPATSQYFVLDDISFAAYSIKKDSVIISVDTPYINTTADTVVCQSSPVLINTTGAVTYSWSPVAGLSNAAVGNPIATPNATTKYSVTGTNTFGCIATDSLTITVNPKPVITKTGDTSVCRNTAVPLFATGGTSYLWSPVNTLNNPTSPNPIARPTANTVYFVKVTGANNCSNNDSVIVTIKPLPTFTVSPSKSSCVGASPQLNASGGNFYLWSPAALVSNPNISNPVATAGSTTTYTVAIKETTCNDSTSLSTTLTVLPLPTVEADKSNDINCSVGSAKLTATGALQYTWSPAAGLDDIRSPSPFASPAGSTTYTVKGTDKNGCSNTDAVTVVVDLSGKATYLMPNAFSPNGDGKNDCYRIKYFGQIRELQFFIFNRWGTMVFSTTNPDDCWDGNYKGNAAEGGNYVYYIKARTACGPVERKGNLILVR